MSVTFAPGRKKQPSRGVLRVKTTTRDVFLSLLTPKQRDEYLKVGYFTVVGSKGTIYTIQTGYSGNVYRRRGGSFCAHPRTNVRFDPDGFIFEAMIAQKLAIETDETAFRRVAVPC